MEVRCRCVIIYLFRKWLHLEPLRRMIVRTVLKASTNQTNNWPIKTYRPSNQRQATEPRVVRLQQSKQLIRERSNLNKKWLTKHENKYKYRQRFGVGQRSGSGARDLEPARGQEPTAGALKIQEVQKVDIGR